MGVSTVGLNNISDRKVSHCKTSLPFYRYDAALYCQKESVNGLLMILKSSDERRELIQRHSGLQSIVGNNNSMWIGLRHYVWEWINGKQCAILRLHIDRHQTSNKI